jgi:hypothetical protein
LGLYQVVFKTGGILLDPEGSTLRAWVASDTRPVRRLDFVVTRTPRIESRKPLLSITTWYYTLMDTASQAVLSFKTREARAETTVRDVITVLPPKAIISDGCPMIQAGAAWWASIPQGLCWFHVMQAMSKLASKERDAQGVSER